MPESRLALTGVSPMVEGLRWESATVLRIGRNESLDVVVPDRTVDRIHAEIKFHGQRWLVRPLTDSAYYSLSVNGAAVPSKGLQVRLRDVVQVGSIQFRVSSLGAEDATDIRPIPARTVAAEAVKSASKNSMVLQTTISRSPPSPSKSATIATATLPPPARLQVAMPPIAPADSVPAPRPAARAPADLASLRPGKFFAKAKVEPPHRYANDSSVVVTGAHERPDLSGGSAASPVSRSDMQLLRVQASTQRSWDQALEDATKTLGQRPDAHRTMLTLLRANHHLSNVSHADELLQNVLVDAVKAVEAQRGAILLLDPTSQKLRPKAHFVVNPAIAVRKGYSSTLADRCFRQGESLLCGDLKDDLDPNAARSAMVGSMSSVLCALLRTPRRRLGVLHLDRGPFQDPFTESDLYLADAIAANVSVGIECAQLVEGQRDQFLQTVTTLARAVEARDQYTGDHTKRVTDFALLLADQLDVTAIDRYQIQIGTPLHDIGKIGIDDAVLRKPGQLTPSEFEHMKSHTVKGAAMLDGSFNLAQLVPIVRHHHERWNGTGYPDGLDGEKISLTARIVSVADCFDAMTSNRPYRPALPPQLAFLELMSKAGSHFDPQVVNAFVRARPQIEQVMQTHRDA